MTSADQKIINQISQMSLALDRFPNKLYAPSALWQQLHSKHIDMLRRYGFASFKRTINFEYGQWGVSALGNTQFLGILQKLVAKRNLPYVAVMSRCARTHNKGITWPVPAKHELFTYKLFVGALWQFARLEDSLSILDTYQEPTLGQPIEIIYRGQLISQDLAQSSLELNRVAAHMNMQRVQRVAEVGAGYGRLAYVFAKMFPNIEYCIFDIPPALAISQNYLAGTLGENKVARFKDDENQFDKHTAKTQVFLPYQLESFPDGYFDLVISINSLDEMLPEQVENYLKLIERKCGGWLYLKGYTTRDRSDPSRRIGVEEFPYMPGWQRLYQGLDPLQSRFTELIFQLAR